MNYNESAEGSFNHIPEIPKEKFQFVSFNETEKITFAGKTKGYFADCMTRFFTNKTSVLCFVIIFILILYSIFAPIFSKYKISDKDAYYAYVNPSFMKYETQVVNQQTYDYLINIPGAVVKDYGLKKVEIAGRLREWHKIKIDTYAKVGWKKLILSDSEFNEAKAYEEKNNVQIFYPVIDEKKVTNAAYKNDMNAWFKTDDKGVALKNPATGSVEDIFLKENESPLFFIEKMDGKQKEVRVLYKEWYKYKHGFSASFLFGADSSGYDIFTRLAYGARLSLILSICVAAINLFLGIIIGSIEGYYGGTVDLVIERIKDILGQVPSVILMTLFQLYFAKKAGPIVSMFFAFIFFGWIGTSSTVRAQFYRFKGQEYVMASRTLGAKDSRLIFKHILPNAIGFIITTSVLSIPAVIFSEANLTYLGIVNLQSDTMTSVGTMLNAAQSVLSTHPHCVFFPASFISILLICFNEFGNGLRDAFNPSLKGTV